MSSWAFGLGIIACTEPNQSTGPTPHDFHGHFFDQPWPDDRRQIDGRLDLQSWPDRDKYDLLETFLQNAEDLRGFGTTTPIYYRFDQAVDSDILPSPQESIEPESPLYLVNIDSTSAYYGERIPIRHHFQEEETHWQPSNLLAIAPIWGYPLRPATKYALVLTTQFAQATEKFSQVWASSHPDFSHFAPLREWLFFADIPLQDIAHATIFTTQNPLTDMVHFSEFIDHRISKPRLDQRLHLVRDDQFGRVFEGKMLVPLWQHGIKPYTQEGGHFAFTEAGDPILADWEYTAFTLTLPKGDMPEHGWPVALYSHGTGGDHRTFASSGSVTKPASQFSQAGFVGLGISQPLHGDRGTGASSQFLSFNYLNPPAGRAAFRQGALDQMYLAALMSTQKHEFITEEGESFHTDPNQLVYVGHSQGGVVGSIALPFMADKLDGAVLSGAGGGLSITLLYREAEDIDIETLVRTAMDFDDHEDLTQYHPILTIVQLLSEVIDPINYARYWNHEKPWWSSAPVSVLQTEGLQDSYTPPECIEALSVAARIPILGQVHAELDGHKLLDLYDESSAQGNKLNYLGEYSTAGLIQYPDLGHFVIFDNEQNASVYRKFIRSAIENDIPQISP